MKNMTIVFDVIAAFDIEVPDDDERDSADIANEWFTEHFNEVAEAINDCEIEIRDIEVFY